MTKVISLDINPDIENGNNVLEVPKRDNLDIDL
jgi:hypothetical protein